MCDVPSWSDPSSSTATWSKQDSLHAYDQRPSSVLDYELLFGSCNNTLIISDWLAGRIRPVRLDRNRTSAQFGTRSKASHWEVGLVRRLWLVLNHENKSSNCHKVGEVRIYWVFVTYQVCGTETVLYNLSMLSLHRISQNIAHIRMYLDQLTYM